MVKLQLLIAPHVSGYLHVQTNPKLSYSQTGTVNNAKSMRESSRNVAKGDQSSHSLKGIIAIFQALAPDFDTKRICIKIPATWEGLSACRALEADGIATLATTMFCMEQAALASDANCTYIAPYINELKVHFETGYVSQCFSLTKLTLCRYIDLHKAFSFCREAQAYYDANNQRTRVLAASLTSVEEVLQLAGVHHVTISPILLSELSRLDATTANNDLGDYFAVTQPPENLDLAKYSTILENESSWRLAFTRSGFGTSEGKIIQAINYFSDFQEKLEEIAGSYTI